MENKMMSEEQTLLELAEKLKNLETELIKSVAKAMKAGDIADKTSDTMHATDEGKAWVQAHQDVKLLSAEANKAEDAYKEAMIEYFEATKLKDYKFGQIKMFDNIFFDSHEAVAWAIEHKLVECLELNDKVFKDIAKSLHLGWVMHLETPKANIARIAVDKAIKAQTEEVAEAE